MLDDGDEEDDDDDEVENMAIEEEADTSIDALADDEGQGVHNKHVAKTLSQKAIEIMENKGVYIDRNEEKSALQIFPRVSTLIYLRVKFFN